MGTANLRSQLGLYRAWLNTDVEARFPCARCRNWFALKSMAFDKGVMEIQARVFGVRVNYRDHIYCNACWHQLNSDQGQEVHDEG